MLLWMVFGFWGVYPHPGKPPFVPYVGVGLIFALIFILGWKTFGFIIQGG